MHIFGAQDSHEEAALAAPHTLRLCALIDMSDDWEDEIERIVDQLMEETGRKAIYAICWY